MTGWAEFITARLAGDEDGAADVHMEPCSMYDADPGSRFCDCGYPATVTRRVQAMRDILELCETETDQTGGRPLAIRVRAHLASFWSDHPDYPEAGT